MKTTKIIGILAILILILAVFGGCAVTGPKGAQGEPGEVDYNKVENIIEDKIDEYFDEEFDGNLDDYLDEYLEDECDCEDGEDGAAGADCDYGDVQDMIDESIEDCSCNTTSINAKLGCMAGCSPQSQNFHSCIHDCLDPD